MAASTIIIDYLGEGAHADRPTTPNIPVGGTAIFAESDTGDTFAWVGGAWEMIAGSSLAGISQLTGDVTAGPGGGSLPSTIAAHAVSNAKMAQAPARTMKGNTGSAPADVADLTVGDVLGMLGAGFRTLALTTDHTATIAENGIHYNNLAAPGDLTLTLPAAADGFQYGFAVAVPHYLRALAAGTDTIKFAALSGSYVRCNTPFGFLQLEAHSLGAWLVTHAIGAWELDGAIVGVIPYSVGFSFVGGVLGNAQLLGMHKFPRAVTLPANLVGSVAGATANATASTVISVDRALAASPSSFTQIGSITFAAGGTTATFATVGGTAKAMATGDVLRLVGPSTADATLANLYSTLLGETL
jgi:hypothetical protein